MTWRQAARPQSSSAAAGSGAPSRGDTPTFRRIVPSGGASRVSARAHRRLVRSLESLANRQPPSDRVRRRFEVLLYDRVALVRADLLEIATLLEHEPEPDPGCVAALHRLLTDGCESPLYNAEVHPSELRATIFYVRSRLTARY
ncbi:MAG: hypothetical protein ACTHMY_12145 [Solirubrobacteraceae bacterium]